MLNLCKYVNVFQGSGEINLPKPKGIAASWFFIKAGCGNTVPAAALPFSRISVSPFSGGYPTGYGDHMPNSHSRPAHFQGGKKLYGFAHLQQSGTGAMGYYYNYAVVTPRYKNSPELRGVRNESACPGFYSVSLEGIRCELTVTDTLALHRYTFSKSGGRVTIDFSNNGLRIPDWGREGVEQLQVFVKNGRAYASAVIEELPLFFAVAADKGEFSSDESSAELLLPRGAREINLRVAISAKSLEAADAELDSPHDFDEAKNAAYERWNSLFNRLKIDADENIKEIFYSNLYHSLIKPSNWQGESFIYDSDGAFMLDFNTLWDMYKTALPLIFMLCKEETEAIAETLMRVCEELRVMPNSFGLTGRYNEVTNQARMLGDYVLLTAYRFGCKIDVRRLLEVIKTDLIADNKTDFTVEGKCLSNTWQLDMADACGNAAQLARETGNNDYAEFFAPFAECWASAYSAETGLLKADSSYYEGTLYNYSFRQMLDMDSRIALAGGRENFVALLDKFFGYGAPKIVQPTDPHDISPVNEGLALGRFEGYNNESDTEAPYSYIYAGRHDRTCEIVRGGMKYMFTKGRGGIPGNNDSGALSSLYVLGAVGLFPVAGQDLILLGSPIVNSAEIALSSGKKLKITVKNGNDKSIYVKSVKLNGKAVSGYRLKISEIMQGGKLEFVMTDLPQA